MSVKFVPVIWNRNKAVYDAVVLAGIVVYIFAFLRLGGAFDDLTRPVDGAIVRMRAFGSCAFFMLTAILCIGPLARIDPRFLPLLYNRRHFGVMTATVAAVHASSVLGWYYAFSPVDRYAALLASNTDFGQFLGFPFEVFGILSLVILFVLAATSHDFWLSFLTPPVWKTLHMGIYAAYGMIVLHIGLGALQSQSDPTFAVLTGISVAAVAGLHFAAGRRERRRDKAPAALSPDGWVYAGEVDDIADKSGITVAMPDGERVAVFHYSGKLSAVSNVCAHQNGPLGEGRIRFGCITCPWHGFQYRPEDGCAPPPFTEKIATYHLRLAGRSVYVNPSPEAPGTRIEPVIVEAAS